VNERPSRPDDATAVVICRIPGMTSRRAVRAVTARLLDLPGVQWVQADPTTARLVVNGTVHGTDVQRALTEIGYPGVGF
jgi:copper chaperone CopZ